MSRLLVISDLHIRGSNDPLYFSMIRLLGERAEAGDVLVFAGDVFDFFVGNKRVLTDRYVDFIQAMQAAGRRGVVLHYIEGNHDFHLQSAFAGIPGLSIHAEETSFEIAGKKFLVAHGDLADSKDHGYRLLRGFFRSPLIKAFVRVAPGAWVDKIGKMSSETSQKKNPRLPGAAVGRLRNMYRSYAAERLTEGFDYMVMGHCHDLDEMRFTIGGRPAQYINVGYPRVHGSFLSWSPGDELIQREALPGT